MLQATSFQQFYLQPYLELARLTKPQVGLFFFWPTLWACTMAAYSTNAPFSTYTTVFMKCAFACLIVRTSGCTINDILDREYDAQTERCKTRPLPSGRITVHAAWYFYLAVIGIGIAHFATFSYPASLAGLVQLIPLSCLYPFMKRLTYWPQVWLGVTINFGIVYSWILLAGTTNLKPLCLLLSAAWCWTMVYETVYACQDMKDDAKAGVMSTGVILADYIRLVVSVFAILFVAILAWVGWVNGHQMPYFICSVGAVAMHLSWQLLTVDITSPGSCWAFFQQNSQYTGLIVFVGQFMDYIWVKKS